jgi:hypothetical protein
MAEYALLTLIEDANVGLKIATIICAVAALATLEFESWLRSKSNHAFYSAIVLTAVIYAAFIGLAIVQMVYRNATRDGLENRYVSASSLSNRAIVPNAEGNHFDPDFVMTFSNDVENWENDCANWILQRLSPAARERFLDRSGYAPLSWSNKAYGNNLDYDHAMNRLASDRKNLANILETKAYDR